MSGLQMLGAIAGGIRQGQDDVDRKRKLKEDRDYQATLREHQQRVMAREVEKDNLNASMAQGYADSTTAASAQTAPAPAPAPAPGMTASVNPNEAAAHSQSADSIAQSMTGGQMQQSPLAASMGTAGQPAKAQATAMPFQRGTASDKPVPMPDMSETKPAASAAKMPMLPDGSLNIPEVVRPKRTADALFYQGPWQSKLRAEYTRLNGAEAAVAMDAKLKSAAEAGYRQRVLEAAELQKAGDMKSAALKLNEIYNRDYVDGAFSNVRFIDDNTVEVVRFLPDGRIVDRTVQPMPDMMVAARQLLSEDKRAELLLGTGKKEKPMVFTDEATGQAVLYDHTTGNQETLQGLKPNSMVLGEQNLQLRKQESSERSADRAADNARADEAAARAERTAARSGKLTEAQIQANKIRDAKIKQARKDLATFTADRTKAKLPVRPRNKVEEQMFTLAKEPLTTEVQ